MDKPPKDSRLPAPRRAAKLTATAIVGLWGLGLHAGVARAAHPNALWHVVHDLCVPDRRLTGFSAPCVAVDLKAGYAVAPDPRRRTQLLLVPTRRVTGIEDPQLLEPGAPNYWEAAWAARTLLARRVGAELSRGEVGMAVNAVASRSQQQLHIHLSCVRPDVAEALRAAGSSLGERWSNLTLGGHAWRARVVTGADLGESDPFKLLAAADPAISAHMGEQTLVLVGAELGDRGPGFYLLSRTTDPVAGFAGHGEFLLDESCGGVTTRSP